jgi:predicted nucleotidyltransferase
MRFNEQSGMNQFIDTKREKLTELCVRYRVRRLEVFGSAAGNEFDSETSDLDFLVEFQDLRPGEHADAYFGLLESLQDLFDRPIDLLMLSAITNPFLMRRIEESRTLLYAA